MDQNDGDDVVSEEKTDQDAATSDEEKTKRISSIKSNNSEEIRPAEDDEHIQMPSGVGQEEDDDIEGEHQSRMDANEDDVTEKKKTIMRRIFQWVMKDDDKLKEPDVGKDLLEKTDDVAGKSENGDLDDEHVRFEEKYESEETESTFVTFHRAYKLARRKKLLLGTIALLVLMMVIVIVLYVTFGGGPTSNVKRTVRTLTYCGPIEGQVEDGAVVFLGVPYAIPPVGNRRWKPSEMASRLEECWPGVYQAFNKSALCYQKLLPHPFGNMHFSEDCLYLDIYTPEVTYATPRPVILYFAGDSFQGHDATDITWRPSAALARAKGVVFVTVHYRMNAFGFLALELLTRNVHPPTSGNYGLHDMVTAVQWVNENIEHFGGNPSKVTILGHGSGATGVMALMSYHKTRLLFTQAWVTGGSASFVNKTLRDVERDNEAFNRYLVCETAECLYGKSADRILSAVPVSEWPYWGDPNYLDLPTSDEHTAAIAIIDGAILYDVPSVMWNSGHFNDVAFVVGSSTHAVGARPLFEDFENWNWTKYLSHVTHRLNTFGANLAKEAISKYNHSSHSPQEQYIEMVSDLRVTCPLLQLSYSASKIFSNNVYSYIVDYIPDGVVKHVTHGHKMAVHGLDVIAIFGRLKEHVHNPSKRDLDFERRMQDMFYAFVHTGKVSSVNGPANLNPKMPWYVNRVGDQLTHQVLPYSNCELWTNNGMYPKHGRMN